MDIELFFAVLKRFWKIVLGGLVLAIALAVLAHMHRTVTYESQAEALITAPPQPSLVKGQPPTPANTAANAAIYVQFANADAVQQHLRSIPGSVIASEITDPSDGADLPFVALTATAATPQDAVALVQKTFSVLTTYIGQQQAADGVAPNQRATLRVIASGNPPKLAGGSSTTVPLLVFVAVLGAAIAIAFMLENARPQTAARLGRVAKPGPIAVEHAGRTHGGAAPHAPHPNGGTAPHPFTAHTGGTPEPANLASRRDAAAHRADDGGASKALLDRLITRSSDSS
jgi:hypothetical protein